MYAIQTQALTKKYKDTLAVDNIDLNIFEGELFALLGVNGAGKSTLIKMLSCLSRPTSGDAFLMGESVKTSPMRVKEKIGVSPQETAIAPNLSVKENLGLIAGIYKRAEAEKEVEDIMHSLGMDKISQMRARRLSGGWQRRLSIAMALVSSPRILFLDEPTLGLDVLARRELWSLINNLKGKITIILTTHYLEEAEALADRIGIIAQGRLIASGTAGELKALAKTDNFEDAFISLAAGGNI